MRSLVVLSTVLALAVSAATTASATASLTSSFCSHNQDTLYINGTVQMQETYALCMDVGSLSYRREDAAYTPSTNLVSLFFNNTLYKYQTYMGNGSAVAETCTMTKSPVPTTPESMPFSFILVDTEARVTGEQLVAGREAVRWEHLRPAGNHGVFHTPAENMNWFATKAATFEQAGNLALTQCIQHYGAHPGDKGNYTMSVGQRDYYHKAGAYVTPAPAERLQLPAGIQCTAPPQGGRDTMWLF